MTTGPLLDIICANYFNSHPRKGGDGFYHSAMSGAANISIPTPVKGVTLALGGDHGLMLISIPTPVKGVTFSAISRTPMVLDFNSHPRKGGDM